MGYVMDENVEFVLERYRTVKKGTNREYVNKNFFNVNFNVKKDFRSHGKIYVTDDLIEEVVEFSQATFVLIFYILKKLVRDDNRVFLTSTTFTQETGLSDASFYRALKQLREAKWIIETSPKHFNVNINKMFKGSVEKLLKNYQLEEKRRTLELEKRAKIINEEREKRKTKEQIDGDKGDIREELS